MLAMEWRAWLDVCLKEQTGSKIKLLWLNWRGTQESVFKDIEEKYNADDMNPYHSIQIQDA